ncbi:hypothetical protein SETIT_7G068000v2 [Setaria italica]|uniref:PB1-like domain-containing protein n=1 Tax=Setaria italica TaxID=4555 RepID=A0A368RSM5_SETIT|nr:hypothetical protein SETIT_7G068000v2 [Setaria italica]
MDRDEICYFNLISLIEEYGYKSIAYLYYKRSDSLVAIQWDTEVMEMLKENESKKEVSLFVTRQKIAIIAPESNKEATKPAPKKAKGKRDTKKRQELNVIQTEAQYANEVDQQHDDDIEEMLGIYFGQPIGKQGGLLGQFLGTIARNGWRNVKKDNSETILQCIQTKFLYPRSCDKWILKSIGRDWRKYKKGRQIASSFVTHSEKNKISREMKKTTHTAGAKSYARWSEELAESENLIDKRPELAQNSEGRVAWEGDALHQVLGEEKSGQVYGMGLLPIPKQVYGRTTRRFKDINIATIDGSSADVEIHMLEEIKQLKEHMRNRDKVIDELLINKQGHHGNEEPTKANCISTDDHDNFRNHVAHSNRKRVQCAKPNCGEAFCKQRDRLLRLMIRLQARSRSKNAPPPPVKVGSTVILKSGNYPNKAVVAYATILSSSPKENVGRIKLGKQFFCNGHYIYNA